MKSGDTISTLAPDQTEGNASCCDLASQGKCPTARSELLLVSKNHIVAVHNHLEGHYFPPKPVGHTLVTRAAKGHAQRPCTESVVLIISRSASFCFFQEGDQTFHRKNHSILSSKGLAQRRYSELLIGLCQINLFVIDQKASLSLSGFSGLLADSSQGSGHTWSMIFLWAVT